MYKTIIFLSDVNKTWFLSGDFWNITKLKITKIYSLRAEVFHADGRIDRQTDRQAGRRMTKLIAFYAQT